MTDDDYRYDDSYLQERLERLETQLEQTQKQMKFLLERVPRIELVGGYAELNHDTLHWDVFDRDTGTLMFSDEYGEPCATQVQLDLLKNEQAEYLAKAEKDQREARRARAEEAKHEKAVADMLKRLGAKP